MIDDEELQKIMDKTSKMPYPKIPKLYPNTKYARNAIR